MKTIYALFSSAIATVAICLLALILTACTREPAQTTQEEMVPIVPTTLVYSIDAPDGFDRNAIAYRQNPQPETYKITGTETTISLSEAFAEVDSDEDFFATDLTPDNDFQYSTEISVLEAVTCHAVEGRSPVDESSYFQAENGKVWLYSKVALPEQTTGLVQHVWKLDGIEKHRVVLMVEGPTYRTASYKTMNADLKGDWTVEVTTENGEVLEQVAFQVQ